MKVAVLTSGGVDSSVALVELKKQGHDVTAFYLKIWLEDELSYLGQCPWEEDLRYVEQICKTWSVPLEIISFQQEYWDIVVAYALAELKAGRTPSPDLMCNERIKFGAFYQAIDDSFTKIATGHYAQTEEVSGTSWLTCAIDPIKDQTYFLSRLSQQQLHRAWFPIGHLPKAQVRERAREYQLPNNDRKDSQGICFLGKIKFQDFVKHHLGVCKGDFIELETQKVIGQHEGFWYHTIGQRKGMGLSGGPWYVVKKDINRNIVYISRNYYTPDKVRNHFIITDLQWLSQELPTGTHQLEVKIRHSEHKYHCSLDLDGSTGHVRLNEQDQGISPGQFAVFYTGNRCLGSARIASAMEGNNS